MPCLLRKYLSTTQLSMENLVDAATGDNIVEEIIGDHREDLSTTNTIVVG